MAADPAPREPRVSAEGARSVAVGRDVVNSVIVTGDNATIQLKLGPFGALIGLLGLRRKPTRRARPTPLDNRPAAFPNHVDRGRELDALCGGDRAVNVYGEAGIG